MVMKCQRCGNNEVRQDGHLMSEAFGAGATEKLTLAGLNGKLIADVCSDCAVMLKKLGWK